MLVLEDVHWADAATLDLIRFIGRRVARLNTPILITYRDKAGAQLQPTAALATSALSPPQPPKKHGPEPP